MMESSNNRGRAILAIAMVVIMSLGLFGCYGSGGSKSSAVSSVSSASNKNLTAQAMPSNGAVLSGSSSGTAGIEVTASNANAYVKIKSSGSTVVSFFVRANSTAEVSVNPGTYSVQFALGETWYGTSGRFGSDTSYGQDSSITLGYGDVMTYSLKRTAGGNFSMGSLNPSDF